MPSDQDPTWPFAGYNPTSSSHGVDETSAIGCLKRSGPSMEYIAHVLFDEQPRAVVQPSQWRQLQSTGIDSYLWIDNTDDRYTAKVDITLSALDDTSVINPAQHYISIGLTPDGMEGRWTGILAGSISLAWLFDQVQGVGLLYRKLGPHGTALEFYSADRSTMYHTDFYQRYDQLTNGVAATSD